MSLPGPLAAALVALFVTYALTPVVRRVARRLGAIDYPGGRRVNTRPMPRLGGIAIYLGFIAAAIVAMVATRPIELCAPAPTCSSVFRSRSTPTARFSGSCSADIRSRRHL
jgi:UDP-GlcNAc:undecaprenyl-phosphate GlcNAc-1-phosphate transferase